LLEFSESAFVRRAAASESASPIIVDVPEIQVSIVPRLQQTFLNPVYCCATTSSESKSGTKAANGLKVLAKKYPNGIYLIGQDGDAMTTMVELIEQNAIAPGLAIATPPTLIESKIKQQLKDSNIPNVHINGVKGGANIASAIFNSLLQLVWQVERQKDRLSL